MDKNEYLEKKIFVGLENLNEDSNVEYHFSETHFNTVLDRCKYFGIGIFKIEAMSNGELFETKGHEGYRKKATDPRWFKNAFIELKKMNPDMQYTASYKVSPKLLS